MTCLATTTLPSLTDRPNRPDSFVWRTALGSAGILLWLIGSLTLVAWATGNVEYVQIDSTLSPLHYNAAFGFLLWGTGYLALVRGWRRLAQTAACGMLALGLVLVAAQFS